MFKQIAKIVGSGAVEKRKPVEDFFTAVIIGDLTSIGKLIKDGVDPNTINDDSLTALHIVAEKGDIAVGKYLLGQKNIDVNKHTNTTNGNPPIMTAVIFNRMHFSLVLLQHGANPNIQNTFGRTALHAAVKNRNIIMVKNLLVSKAQPNTSDVFGNTPLSFSIIEYPSHSIADTLMNWGSDPNFRTAKPHPLLLELALNCRSAGHISLVKLLLHHDADVNIKNLISQQTALHIVSITGYVPLAKILLKHGANPTLRDLTGRTPYDMAVEHHHLALVAFYKERKTVVKDFMVSIKLEEDDEPMGQLTSIIISKKKPMSIVPRTVRFSEIQSSESDDELYIQHL